MYCFFRNDGLKKTIDCTNLFCEKKVNDLLRHHYACLCMF